MSDVVNFLQRIVMNMQIKPGLTQKPSTHLLSISSSGHAPSQEITLDVQKVSLMNQLVHLKPRILNVWVLEIWTIQGIGTIWDKFL